jgi:alanine dehydrogenase
MLYFLRYIELSCLYKFLKNNKIEHNTWNRWLGQLEAKSIVAQKSIIGGVLIPGAKAPKFVTEEGIAMFDNAHK